MGFFVRRSLKDIFATIQGVFDTVDQSYEPNKTRYKITIPFAARHDLEILNIAKTTTFDALKEIVKQTAEKERATYPKDKHEAELNIKLAEGSISKKITQCIENNEQYIAYTGLTSMSGRDWLSAMLPYMDRGNEERVVTLAAYCKTEHCAALLAERSMPIAPQAEDNLDASL